MQDAIRVLYVDDEPDLLDIGKQFLEESGDFSVTTSGSAPAALDLISREKFEVIISDYQMPEMDGVQFLVEVRSRYGQVPFIMLTGRGSEEVAIQAINNGVDFYLQKGGEPEAQFSELSDKIKSVASWKRADEARKRAAFLEAQVETSPDGISITALDGTIQFVTSQIASMYGYDSTEKLIGMNSLQFVHPILWQIFHSHSLLRCL